MVRIHHHIMIEKTENSLGKVDFAVRPVPLDLSRREIILIILMFRMHATAADFADQTSRIGAEGACTNLSFHRSFSDGGEDR